MARQNQVSLLKDLALFERHNEMASMKSLFEGILTEIVDHSSEIAVQEEEDHNFPPADKKRG